MKKKSLLLWLSTLYFFIALHSGCKQQPPEIPLGRLTSQSSCKYFAAGPASGFVPTDEPECMYYRYAGNTLYLSHRNPAFNCCPGEIKAAISLSGQTITIRETEREAGCHCLCLYDLEMEVSDLPPGIYHIKVEEPYLGTQTPLDFICNLEREDSGEYCLDRDGYPWEAE